MFPESHFTNVLHTNYIPSANELQQLQDIVVESRDRIRKLDEDVHRLQAERDELQQFVDSHTALAAPFRRFPADILGEIFFHCLPTNKFNVAVCTVKEAPLLFTTVCRAWREIALNTPRLWSSVHISFPRPPRSTTSGTPSSPQIPMLQGIKLWLDRSGSRPLTLSIYTGRNIQWSPPGPAVPEEGGVKFHDLELMNLLVGYSHRWKVLLLGDPLPILYQQQLVHLTAEDVPLLEAVYTEEYSFFGALQNHDPLLTTSCNPTPMANFMTKVTSLRTLHLHPASISTLELPLSWSQLTVLNFDYRPTSHPSAVSPIFVLQKIAQICCSLKNLTYCATLRPMRFGAASGPADPIEWNTLRQLTLVLRGQLCNYASYYEYGPDNTDSFPFLSCVTDIYRSIVTPQLVRLTLRLSESHIRGITLSDEVMPFHTLIKGSPHLTHLQIEGYHILGASALSRCLGSAPSLTSLTLRPEISERSTLISTGQRSPKWQVDAIAPPPGWVPKLLRSLNELDSWPQLKVFDCGRCEAHHIASVLDFVQAESRMSRLKYFQADIGTLWRKEIISTMTSPCLLETLQSLRVDHGISVVLNWSETEPPPDTQWHNDPYNGLPIGTLWDGDG